MRQIIWILIAATLGSASARAQNNEIGLLIGGISGPSHTPVVTTFTSAIGTLTSAAGNIDTSNGFALEGNVAHKLISIGPAALFGEFNVLANGVRDVTSTIKLATHDYASLYLTPGIRLKIFPGSKLSPYGVVGGGLAWYQQSKTRLDGSTNTGSRNTYQGVLDYGVGIDYKLIHWISIRVELRDFYSGNPSLNIPLSDSGQHNIVGCAGLALHF